MGSYAENNTVQGRGWPSDRLAPRSRLPRLRAILPLHDEASKLLRLHHEMKFGLFFQTPEAPGQSHGERFAEMLDRIVLADSLGFDVAWLAELHFGGAFSLLSSPLMAVPVIAQRTKRIRVGAGVTLPPLPPPPSSAAEAAPAD